MPFVIKHRMLPVLLILFCAICAKAPPTSGVGPLPAALLSDGHVLSLVPGEFEAFSGFDDPTGEQHSDQQRVEQQQRHGGSTVLFSGRILPAGIYVIGVRGHLLDEAKGRFVQQPVVWTETDAKGNFSLKLANAQTFDIEMAPKSEAKRLKRRLNERVHSENRYVFLFGQQNGHIFRAKLIEMDKLWELLRMGSAQNGKFGIFATIWGREQFGSRNIAAKRLSREIPEHRIRLDPQREMVQMDLSEQQGQFADSLVERISVRCQLPNGELHQFHVDYPLLLLDQTGHPGGIQRFAYVLTNPPLNQFGIPKAEFAQSCRNLLSPIVDKSNCGLLRDNYRRARSDAYSTLQTVKAMNILEAQINYRTFSGEMARAAFAFAAAMTKMDCFERQTIIVERSRGMDNRERNSAAEYTVQLAMNAAGLEHFLGNWGWAKDDV